MRGHYDNNDRGRRQRSRSRSNSRERDRDRKRNRDDFKGNNREEYRGNRDDFRGEKSRAGMGHQGTNPYANHYLQGERPNNWVPNPESATIMIKGLPAHTTEPTLYAVVAPYYPKEIRLMTQRAGDCKGYAFVEFVSLEHAQYFMMTFAGSTGDPHAPQLIVENRAVQLDYAREKTTPSTYEPKGGGGGDKKPIRSDWLCTKCSCHNFAKRDTCFKCNSGRDDSSQSIVGEMTTDSVVSSDTPSVFLVVRGFNLFASEFQIAELFRPFAVVKSVVILKDPTMNYSKAMAFVEFHSVEYSTYALQNSSALYIDAILLKVSYARESVLNQLIQQSMQPGSLLVINPIAAAAIQSAQWSAQGYGSAPVMPSGNQQPPASLMGYNASSAPTTIAAPKVKSKFPLQFETNGGAYVFQVKSGCFFDPNTEFYYCTRSKLYYNAKDGTYYTYDSTVDPPYKKFEPPLPIEPESNDEKSAETSATVTPALTAKDTSIRLPVSLSLGGGLMKPKTGGTAGKKVLQNLAKWGSLQDDEDEVTEGETGRISAGKGRAQAVVVSAPVTSSGPVLTNAELSLLNKTSSPPVVAPVVPKPVPVTSVATAATPTPTPATSSFVCLLCRRQFNSAEMLGKHERESKLHADNLKAQQQSAASADANKESQPTGPAYRDRAAERRQLVGVDTDDSLTRPSGSTSDSGFGPNFSSFVSSGGHMHPETFSYSAIASAPTPVAPPVAVSQDVSNPGNNILRRMGWSDGSGLGKDGTGKEEAVGVELAAARNNIGQGGLVYAAGTDYRDTLKNATRARFDQLPK